MSLKQTTQTQELEQLKPVSATSLCPDIADGAEWIYIKNRGHKKKHLTTGDTILDLRKSKHWDRSQMNLASEQSVLKSLEVRYRPLHIQFSSVLSVSK